MDLISPFVPCTPPHPTPPPVLQSEDPFVVRLLFEPSGRPDSQQDYYLTAKENLCVVCGKADSYIRSFPFDLNEPISFCCLFVH